MKVDTEADCVGKHGYSHDAAATLHNAAVVASMYQGMPDIAPEVVEKQKVSFNLAQLEGILTKALI